MRQLPNDWLLIATGLVCAIALSGCLGHDTEPHGMASAERILGVDLADSRVSDLVARYVVPDSRLTRYVANLDRPTDSLFFVSCEIEDFAKMIRDTSSEEPSPRTMKLWFEPESERLVLAEISGGKSHGAERTEEHEMALADSLLLSVEAIDSPVSNHLTLLEVLKKSRWRPEMASRVTARLFSKKSPHGGSSEPVWLVSLVGIPPRPVHFGSGDEIPTHRRDHLRLWFDAVTGDFLGAENRSPR